MRRDRWDQCPSTCGAPGAVCNPQASRRSLLLVQPVVPCLYSSTSSWLLGMAGTASGVPCTSTVKRRDTSFEMCDDFCSGAFAKTHCSFCKCKACAFCKPSHSVNHSTALLTERHIRGHELNADWCAEALMKRPGHIFRRMWAAESWAPMEQGKPVCWERRRMRLIAA